MCHLFDLPFVLIQLIFTYQDLIDIVPIRSVCKLLSSHKFNKLCWGNRFNFFQLVLNSQTEFDWDKVNPNVIKICTGGGGYYPYIDYDTERLEKILMTMPTNFPNLLSINLGGFRRLPSRTLEYLAKNKKLMFVDIFCESFTDELIDPDNYLSSDENGEDRLEKFVNECKSLIAIDTECPYFGPRIDGYPTCFIRDDEDFQDVLDGKKTISEVEDYDESNVNYSDSDSINARDYPNIRSWNSHRFNVKLIKNYDLFNE